MIKIFFEYKIFILKKIEIKNESKNTSRVCTCVCVTMIE